MAKKRSKKPAAVDTSATAELRHNPFAGLLGGDAPETPAAEAPEEPPASGSSGASSGASSAPTPRFGAKVVVRREKAGRGGKTVTRVSGLSPDHLEALATRLKKSLGCGAKVEAPDLLLLGDVADRAVAWLEAEGAPRVVRGS